MDLPSSGASREGYPMNTPTNNDRANRAFDAVVAYSDSASFSDLSGDSLQEETESFVADLLCDLQHLCKRDGLDFETLLACARGNFDEERTEED
jgi:hypothetical protein